MTGPLFVVWVVNVGAGGSPWSILPSSGITYGRKDGFVRSDERTAL